MKHTLTYDDGKERGTIDFDNPERFAQPGDVYEVVKKFTTLAPVTYEAGDRLTVLERTNFTPYHRKSSLGNLLIRCKAGTSVWSCFDHFVAEGWLKLVASKVS